MFCNNVKFQLLHTKHSHVQKLESEFIKWMDWYGKSYGEFELHSGDFLSPEFSSILSSATYVGQPFIPIL